MNLTIQIGVYAEKNEKFNSLPKNVEFSSIQEMATYLDLESAKYKDDPLLLVRLKDGSQPHLIDYKSNYALRNFIKEVAEHYFNLQNHIPMSENNIIGGKISEIAEKVVNGEYEDFKKFDKNTQNIILMYIEKSERSNRLEVLSDVWNSEITHPSALSKGMTVSQIDEKANNYYSFHRSFQNQQNKINMENQKLSFWDKNITPLTNKYKNFIKEMENTPSEIFYRDGEREFTEQEKKFMEIYKYKENSNISETATILNKIENDSSFFQELPEKLKQNKNFVYEAVSRNLTTLQFVSDEFKNDKDLLKMAVKQYGKLIQYASPELRNNKEVVLEAVKTDGFALEYVSNELKNDREVVLEAVKSNGFALRFASDELRNDKEIALEAIKQNKRNLQYVSDELKNDKDFILEASQQNGIALEYASAELRNNKEVVLEAVKQNGFALEFASTELQNDKSLALEAVKENGLVLQSLPEDLRNDSEVVLEAVKQNGFALHYASEKLRNDREVVLEAVKQNGEALEFASEELRNNRDLVIEAMKRNGKALEFASEELRNDKKVVFEAVKENGVALEFASEELRNDIVYILQILKDVPEILKFVSENIQKEAVRQNGLALEYASEELRNDREVVFEAVKQNGKALEFASEELRNDKDVALESVRHSSYALEYASEELRNDREFILEAVRQDGNAFKFASEELRNNREFILEAVKQNGLDLEYASAELRNDKEIVLEAVSENGYALKYASAELQNDKEIGLEAVKQNKRNLQYVSDELKNDKDFILEALQQNGIALEYASAELRNNKEVVLEAVKQNGFALRFASTELQNDKSLALEAVKENGLVLQSLPEELRNDSEVVFEAVKQNGKALEFASDELKIDYAQIWENTKYIDGSVDPIFNDDMSDDLAIDDPKFQRVIEVAGKFKENPDLLNEIRRVAWNEYRKSESFPPSYPDRRDYYFPGNEYEYEKAIEEYEKEIREYDDYWADTERDVFIKENYPDKVKVLRNFFTTNYELAEKRKDFIYKVIDEFEKSQKKITTNTMERAEYEINQKNIMDEKVESLIGMVANNKVDENVGYKVKLFNELTNEEKSFFKENAKNIAIENIEEIQEGISEEEKQSISQKFDTFFKHIEQDSKKSIEQNEVVNYLKNQLKYLGFGESDDLHRKLQDGVQNTKEKDYFQIEVKSDKALQGNEANFSLSFYKSEKGGVYLNSFKGELKDSKGELKTHSFGVNNFTAKEAVNLLEGRAVKTQFTNKNTGEMEDVFVKLKLNEEKNEFGNYKMQVYNKNYGINTKDIVEKSKLIFSGEDAEKIKDLVIKSLEKGNVVNVRFKNDSNQEMNGKAVLNPQYKNINLYDEQMNRVNTNKPIQGLEADKQQEKNNVREQSRVRSHH